MKKSVMNNLTRKGLELLERRAGKKANAECVGYLYEPQIPNKLKKNVAKGLVCVLTAVSVLAGSVGIYKADTYNKRYWSTYKVNSAVGSQTYTASLYSTEEKYEWSVTSCSYSGYGYVELNGVNNTVVMLNASGVADTSVVNRLSEVNTMRFIRKNMTGTNPYAMFRVTMEPYEDGDSFGGYIEIIQN